MGRKQFGLGEKYYKGMILVAMFSVIIGTFFVVQFSKSLWIMLSSTIILMLQTFVGMNALFSSDNKKLEDDVAKMGILLFLWVITTLFQTKFHLYTVILYFVSYLVVIQYMNTIKRLKLFFHMGSIFVSIMVVYIKADIEFIFAFTVLNLMAGIISYKSSESRILYLKDVDLLLKHDVLTGLPNRRGLYEFFDNNVVGKNEAWAVLYIDLKKFRNVNTIYGQAVGDKVLIQFKTYLSKALNSGDYIARINGNEFVVILKGVENTSGVNAYLNRLKSISSFTLPNGEEMHFGMGVSFYDRDAITKEDLLMTSNMALQSAKEGLGNTVAYYNMLSNISLSKRERIVYALENNIDEVIKLAVQPIQSLNQEDFKGFEALARMSLDGELISPMEFIPLAESLSLIHEIDTLIMEKAIAFLAEYKRVSAMHLRISVNVSKLSLNQAYIDRLEKALSMYEVEPNEVLVEITETKIFTNQDEAVFFINALRQMGFNVAMDDFGSGYTSLSMIQNLPINVIKLDKSLIQGQFAGDMITGVLQLLYDLGLETIVEGIETEEQMNFVKGTHAGYIQGYYIDRPQLVKDLVMEETFENVKIS